MPKLASLNKKSLLASTESLLVFSSISGAVASLVFQQVIFATATSISLSLAFSLNSWNNRKRLDELGNQNQTLVFSLEQQYSKHQVSLNQAIQDLHSLFEGFTKVQIKLQRDLQLLEVNVFDLEQNFLDLNQHKAELQAFKERLQDLQSLTITLKEEWIKKNEIIQTKDNIDSTSISEFESKVDSALNSFNSNLESRIGELKEKDIRFLYNFVETSIADLSSNNNLHNNLSYIELEQKFADSQNCFEELRVSTRQELINLNTQLQEVSNKLIEVSKKTENQLQEISSKILNQALNKAVPFKQLYTCDYCHRSFQTQFIRGGDFKNNKFCSPFCKDNFENKQFQ